MSSRICKHRLSNGVRYFSRRTSCEPAVQDCPQLLRIPTEPGYGRASTTSSTTQIKETRLPFNSRCLRTTAHPIRLASNKRTFSTTQCYSQPTAAEADKSQLTDVYNHPNHRPLDGILVVSLEQVISGPYCTRQLADLGARVIKIERPGTGDFVRYHDKRVRGELCSHFVWTNRNKESLALDIKKPDDLKILKELIKKADVFVQNLVPGAAAKMGLSFNELTATNEKLIMCEISGYGSDGPYKSKKAYDLLVQSEAGLLSITGTPETPCKFDHGSAATAAKDREGMSYRRQHARSAVEWMGFPMLFASDGQSAPPRQGASHASIYPYGSFEASDGNVMLGLQNEREWNILCERVLNMPELEKDVRFTNTTLRSQNRQELYQIMCTKFGENTVAEIVEKLDKAGIANARLNNMQDVWDHPQLAARRRFVEVETEVGLVKTTIPPGMSGDVQARSDPVPGIGQHNDSILAEFGLGDMSTQEQISGRDAKMNV